MDAVPDFPSDRGAGIALSSSQMEAALGAGVALAGEKKKNAVALNAVALSSSKGDGRGATHPRYAPANSATGWPVQTGLV